MVNSETNNNDHETEEERALDHLVDSRGISYADAREILTQEKAAAARRAERHAGHGASRERVRAFTQVADTLFSLDD